MTATFRKTTISCLFKPTPNFPVLAKSAYFFHNRNQDKRLLLSPNHGGFMEINLKDTLRTLRQQKNITQEALANHLGITPQSVGKWERGEGYPDITLLPKIALYFNVTIDALLNVDQSRIDQEIARYEAESSRYRHSGDNAKNLALWEKAYTEFPNDCRVMDGLMTAVSWNAMNQYSKEDAEKICLLGERILQESTDKALRENAVQILCFTCASIGDADRALRYAELGGSMYVTREELQTHILNGEDGVRACQSYLLSLLFSASLTATQMISKASFSPEEAIQAHQFGIDLFQLLFHGENEGFYAGHLSMHCSFIAQKYAEKADAEKTLEYLEQSVKYAVTAAAADKTRFRYTAFLVNRLENNPAQHVKNYKGNACNLRLASLSWEGYDFIRSHERFQKITNTLKAHAEA